MTAIVSDSVNLTHEHTDKQGAQGPCGVFQSSAADRQRVLRKIDVAVATCLSAVYLTQYLDKTALRYATVLDLPIVGQQYNLVALSFHLGYILWVFPTQIIARRFPLPLYLGGNLIVWGIVLALLSIARSFVAFFLCRMLLGALESCVSPLLIIVVSNFYTSSEKAKRIAVFYSMDGLTQVLGGLLAYALSYTHNNKLKSYMLLFILLGIFAVLVGLIVTLYLPEAPHLWSSAAPEDKFIAMERVSLEQTSRKVDGNQREQMLEACYDIKIWLLCLMSLLGALPSSALVSFSTIFMGTYGYSDRTVLLLSGPMGLLASAMTLIVCTLSDRRQDRSRPIILAIAPSVVGWIVLLAASDGPRMLSLLGLYLAGIASSSPAIIFSWIAANVAGSTKKAFAGAAVMFSAALGSLAGTEIFEDGRSFMPGKLLCLIVLVIEMTLSLILRRLTLAAQQRKAALLTLRAAKLTQVEMAAEAAKAASSDLTDKQNPYFAYTA
ncbi:uncharacterized protein L969DRAFT_26315 [Mixia osmundae IAM 14324]|uniref:Major facilitator superfamily (MFS) profile domain-containing protein n=1 Tax=Mixia osmundae (strain CBS 9802 / IAM 14324 / JCM 22182 / KY 12970) TaxID=764103 RepID=G7E2N2_MIXOS|nr:uncharacterized protein L969DRAFT_26315 [Mixia osmundae IAM 14324]KEI36957.1 hypothetical protein L969DRAFT_26315 [Mixia osmundae IAM 14324]GAA97092.1 hypothetical protein E5Q_03767 [Mixia osmundae IAM 14324]